MKLVVEDVVILWGKWIVVEADVERVRRSYSLTSTSRNTQSNWQGTEQALPVDGVELDVYGYSLGA